MTTVLTNPVWLGAILVAVCAVVPLALRFASWRNPRTGGRAPAGSTLLWVVQDLVAAGQLSAVAVLIFAALKSPLYSALLAAPLVATAHLLFVVDHVLWRHLRLRLSWHFLTYARWLPLFAGSSQRAGVRLWQLAVGAIAYLILLGLVFYPVLSGLGRVRFPALWALLAGTLTVIGYVVGRCLPATLSESSPNALLRLECEAVRGMLRRSAAPTVLPPGFLGRYCPNEEWTAGPPETPLLRRTHGYAGEPRFDLELGSDRPHVVLLFLESFCASVIGAIGTDVEASPEFDRLAAQGVLFRACYGNGVQTARAVISTLFGIPPRFSEQPVQADLKRCPRLIGLPQLFQEMGYLNAYFHNGSLAFERQDRFFPRHGYHQLHGYQEIQRQFPEAKFLGGWGLPDEFLMRYFADWLEQQEREGRPSFSTLFTMTNHHPFETPPGFVAPPFNFPENPEKEMFLRTFYYTDHCLGMLLRLLQARGLDRRSLIVILADTAQPLGEHGNWTEQHGLYEENLRIPLLLLAPGRLRAPRVIDTPCSQVDLLPTFIDLYRHPFRHHAMGTSLLRASGDRTICFNTPFGTRAVGLRHGRFKLVHELATGATSLYDLVHDPHERHPANDAHRSVAESLRSELLDTHAAVQALYHTNRFC